MLKKSMLVLSLAAILVAGCSQEKPKTQEQPLPQAKPPVQIESKSTEPKILSKKIIGTRKVGLTKPRIETIEERKVEITLPNGQKKIEIQYFDAEDGMRIMNYNPNEKIEPVQKLQNKGKDVSDFKSH